jgi:uncharacterized membrane protein YfcA
VRCDHVLIAGILFFAAIAIGWVASMVGVGGGIFMVPLLVFLNLVGSTQEAVGTSLAAIVFNSISSTIAYSRQKKIDYKFALALLLPHGAGGRMAWGVSHRVHLKRGVSYCVWGLIALRLRADARWERTQRAGLAAPTWAGSTRQSHTRAWGSSCRAWSRESLRGSSGSAGGSSWSRR